MHKFFWHLTCWSTLPCIRQKPSEGAPVLLVEGFWLKFY
jgi:hypothetical protein